MANSEGYLFYLVPLNDKAMWVVQQESNRKYATQRPGSALCLAFGIHRRSDTAGRLATFGRHKNNDVTLPSHAKPEDPGQGGNAAAEPNLNANSGHTYQNYRNHHCFFFLARSGELILRDLSPRLVHIEVENATPDEATLYALHGNPRQRVIPRISHRQITIIIGTNTYFALEWANRLVESNMTPHASLASQARVLAVPGTTPTPPGRCSRSFGPRGLHSRELHSSHTPSVASKAGPIKSCHKYQKLGAGGFGTVYKVVDLSSGELWAVKEIDKTKKIGSSRQIGGISVSEVKASLIQEVETMAKLSHARIVHYETYQDCRISGSMQIFYRLYEGNLSRLIRDTIRPGHLCNEPPLPPAAWMPRMVTQMAAALAYLHKNGILHLDIKPDNILFDHTTGDQQPNFYLGDFGLAIAVAQASGHDGLGTPFFMAPELTLSLDKPCQASDMWSFAMTIGEALGIWCPKEQHMDASEWAGKLRVLGSKFPYTEAPGLSAFPAEAFYRRISATVAFGVLPPMFSRLLLDHRNRYPAVKCMQTPPEFFIDRPATPEPPKDWKGMDAPWLKRWPLDRPPGAPTIQPNNRTRIPPPPPPPPAAPSPAHGGWRQLKHPGIGGQIRPATIARPQPAPAQESQPRNNMPPQGGQRPPQQQGTAQLPQQGRPSRIPQPPQQRQNAPAGRFDSNPVVDVRTLSWYVNQDWKPVNPEAEPQVPNREGSSRTPPVKRTKQGDQRQESPKPLSRQSSSIPRRQQQGGTPIALPQRSQDPSQQQQPKQQPKPQERQPQQQQQQKQPQGTQQAKTREKQQPSSQQQQSQRQQNQQESDREPTAKAPGPVQVSHTRTPRNDGGQNRFGFRG